MSLNDLIKEFTRHFLFSVFVKMFCVSYTTRVGVSLRAASFAAFSAVSFPFTPELPPQEYYSFLLINILMWKTVQVVIPITPSRYVFQPCQHVYESQIESTVFFQMDDMLF